MRITSFVTIPRKITGSEELVVITRREFNKLVEYQELSEAELLHLSEDARRLKKQGKLMILKSLKDLR